MSAMDISAVKAPTIQRSEPQTLTTIGLGDLRRRTLSWGRSTRISATNATRDRNSPINAYQISLKRSLIDGNIDRFAGVSQLFWVCGRDSAQHSGSGATGAHLERYTRRYIASLTLRRTRVERASAKAIRSGPGPLFQTD